MKIIKCQNCGQEYKQILKSSFWIYCDCGSKICGHCGSLNIESMKIDGTNYNQWYCLDCGKCDF